MILRAVWGVCKIRCWTSVHAQLLLLQCPPLLPATLKFFAPGSFFTFSTCLFNCSVLPPPFLIFPLAPGFFVPCSSLEFPLLLARFYHFLCSMLHDYHLSAPCSFTYFMTCSFLLCVNRDCSLLQDYPQHGLHSDFCRSRLIICRSH